MILDKPQLTPNNAWLPRIEATSLKPQLEALIFVPLCSNDLWMSFSTDFRDFFCLGRKYLLYNLVLRNLKVRYRKSLLGMLWTVLIPAGQAAIFFFVFKFVLKVQIPNYLLHILSGILPWTFLASCLASLESIVANHRLLNKVPLPPHALILSEVLTNFLNFLLSLPVLFVVMAIERVVPGIAFLQVFPLIAMLVLISTSFALILSMAYVYFRDLKPLMAVVMQFWFYLTPIMYRVEMIPAEYRGFLRFNPLGELFAGFHLAIAENLYLTAEMWAVNLIWTIALLTAAFTMFKKVQYRIVELL